MGRGLCLLGPDTFDNRMEREIQARIRKAWNGFWKLQEIPKGNMKTESKIKIWESCVIPILTYETQTWTVIKKLKNKLQTTQRAMERRMIGVKRKM